MSMNERKQCEVCKAVLAHNRKHPNILYDIITGGEFEVFLCGQCWNKIVSNYKGGVTHANDSRRQETV